MNKLSHKERSPSVSVLVLPRKCNLTPQGIMSNILHTLFFTFSECFNVEIYDVRCLRHHKVCLYHCSLCDCWTKILAKNDWNMGLSPNSFTQTTFIHALLSCIMIQVLSFELPYYPSQFIKNRCCNNLLVAVNLISSNLTPNLHYFIIAINTISWSGQFTPL